MKVSDYIVDFLIQHGISDVFGYPGGMVTHFMDSLSKRKEINNHLNYHEQGCAFAACAYAQASNKIGVAYATSGPGATNLITGICNAYFDSIPVIFITGQVNTFEKNLPNRGRQNGFQETNIIDMIKPVTKYCEYIDSKEKIKYCLEKAIIEAITDRPGPVLLDIPMNIFREIINPNELVGYKIPEKKQDNDINIILEKLKKAKRPCILIGNGIKISNSIEKFKILAQELNIPIVSSMLAVDIIPNYNNYYGFIGAYGHRYANFIIAKSDLVISIGSRMDIRQVGGKKENFAPLAKIIKIDIDNGELNSKIRDDQINLYANIPDLIENLLNQKLKEFNNKYLEWIEICNQIKNKLKDLDKSNISDLIKKISYQIPDNSIITTDVGQNQVWISQSFIFKENQQLLTSGGHGAMGYSLPASIGAYYATKKEVVCFSGDGGFQMNMQELEHIKDCNLPINIIIFNNKALGMIRHFQEMYFEKNYTQTVEGNGYHAPNFELIAKAYDFEYQKVCLKERLPKNLISETKKIIEIEIDEDTYVFPKLEYGKPNQDQEPLMDRDLYQKLMRL